MTSASNQFCPVASAVEETENIDSFLFFDRVVDESVIADGYFVISKAVKSWIMAGFIQEGIGAQLFIAFFHLCQQVEAAMEFCRRLAM